MNLADIIIICVLVLCVVAVVYFLLRRKKGSCCGCEGCKYASECEKKNKDDIEKK